VGGPPRGAWRPFCPDPRADDVFDLRGIDRDAGCLVVVRPDQHVAAVLPLDGFDALTDLLSGVLVDAGPGLRTVNI
jgi:phenol 2-monooxygenase (NADPH)